MKANRSAEIETETASDLPESAGEVRHSRKKGVILHETNPFWRPSEVKVRKKHVTIGRGFIAKQDSGETIDFAGIYRVEQVDDEKFVKLFTANSGLFFELAKPAQKLLQFVLLAVQERKGKDGIYLSWYEVEQWIRTEEIKGLSRASYHRAIAELILKFLLAESTKPNFYWFNPHVFFNGDRMVYIQEYRKVVPRPKSRSEA